MSDHLARVGGRLRISPLRSAAPATVLKKHRPGDRTMASGLSVSGPAPRASRNQKIFLSVVLALAAGGVALAGFLLVPGSSADPSAAVTLRTGTGTLSVGPLTVTSQHDPKDMIGMPPSAAHDMAGHNEVVVPVTLTNDTDAPVSYSASQFRLLSGGVQAAPGGQAGQAGSQTLRPQAGTTMRLTFTVPASEHPRLRYVPDGGRPVTAALNAIDSRPAPDGPTSATRPTSTTDHSHDHHSGADHEHDH
jgi:hypothetical protein